MPKTGKATIRDVALRAGVSHQTVSRVVNCDKGVTPETKGRVEEAIADLGYRPNAIARYMAKGNTRTFACITPNMTDYTFSSLIDGAETYAREHGYFMISASAPDAASFSVLVEQLVDSRRTEGLLVINPYADERHKLLPVDVPVVLMGASPRSEGLASVALDDAQGGYIATKHLIELGHKQIALISGPLEEDCTQDRLGGYERALKEAGLFVDPELLYAGDWSATSGQAAVDQFQEIGAQFTAIFAQNDRMAVGAINHLQKSGLRIPEDVSIVGFDDMPLASYFDPPLTTIRQEILAIGSEAARLLLEAKEDPFAVSQQLLFPPELVIRSSTGKASERR
ncbi:MAG: LacI family transcriptional regulator [Anaerolineaceae bacterium]|nr:LacI family transcriptional regulator [Anaerolineaceae bacterium]NTV35949.1 LacI family transcriptional regulator [Anaerolineaceae bacterium]